MSRNQVRREKAQNLHPSLEPKQASAMKRVAASYHQRRFPWSCAESQPPICPLEGFCCMIASRMRTGQKGWLSFLHTATDFLIARIIDSPQCASTARTQATAHSQAEHMLAVKETGHPFYQIGNFVRVNSKFFSPGLLGVKATKILRVVSISERHQKTT